MSKSDKQLLAGLLILGVLAAMFFGGLFLLGAFEKPRINYNPYVPPVVQPASYPASNAKCYFCRGTGFRGNLWCAACGGSGVQK